MGLRHGCSLELRGGLLALLPMLQLLTTDQGHHQGEAGEQTLLKAQWRYTQWLEALASHPEYLPHGVLFVITLVGEVLQSACQFFNQIKINKIMHL